MARLGNGVGHGWGAGPGWGGPARGAGNGSACAPAFWPANDVAAGRHDMRRSQRKEAMLDMLYELANTATNPMIRVHAATSWLNLTEGRPRRVDLTARGADWAALDDAALGAGVSQLERKLSIGG